jgi:hypothetical protein
VCAAVREFVVTPHTGTEGPSSAGQARMLQFNAVRRAGPGVLEPINAPKVSAVGAAILRGRPSSGSEGAPHADPCAPLWQPQLQSRLKFVSACVKQFGAAMDISTAKCEPRRHAVVLRTRSAAAAFEGCKGPWCRQISAPSLRQRLQVVSLLLHQREKHRARAKLSPDGPERWEGVATTAVAAADAATDRRTKFALLADSIYAGEKADIAQGMSKDLGCAPLGVLVLEDADVRVAVEETAPAAPAAPPTDGGGGPTIHIVGRTSHVDGGGGGEAPAAASRFDCVPPALLVPPLLARPTSFRMCGTLNNGNSVWQPQAPPGAAARLCGLTQGMFSLSRSRA